MSAFHLIATQQRTQFYVGFVPRTDSCIAAISDKVEEKGA